MKRSYHAVDQDEFQDDDQDDLDDGLRYFCENCRKFAEYDEVINLFACEYCGRICQNVKEEFEE